RQDSPFPESAAAGRSRAESLNLTPTAAGRAVSRTISAMNLPVRSAVLVFALTSLAGAQPPPAPSAAAQTQGATARSFSVVASRYASAPLTLEVSEDHVVRLEPWTAGIAHSFTIGHSRVAKRVGADQTVTCASRDARPGTFPFYCDLKAEDGCRE